MRRDVAWWGAVILSLLTAGFLPAAAGASELIGRDATGVGLRVDAAGRAAVSFRSDGQSRVVVAWGAVNARHPTRGQPQLAFRLQIGGPHGGHGAGNGTRYRATVIGRASHRT